LIGAVTCRLRGGDHSLTANMFYYSPALNLLLTIGVSAAMLISTKVSTKHDGKKCKEAKFKFDKFMRMREHSKFQVKVGCTSLLAHTHPRTASEAALCLTHYSLEFYWDADSSCAFTLERNKDALSFSEHDSEPVSGIDFIPGAGGPLTVSIEEVRAFLVEEVEYAYNLVYQNCKHFCHKFWVKHHKLCARLDFESFCKNIEEQVESRRARQNC
jgi:hypothetical protein